MKTTLSPCVGAGANQLSCVNISREKRELHASPKHEIADSLAKFTGIIIARGKSMKSITLNLLTALCLGAASLQAHAQGQVIDQESATAPISPFQSGVDGLNIQEDGPLTQSFVPTLSMINFVSMEFEDIPGNGTAGAAVKVNIWGGSPNTSDATLLGTTASVYMPNGFNNSGLLSAGVATFDFTTPISLTAGDAYYLEPVVLSGDNPWDVITIGDTYANGELYGGAGGFTAPFQPSTDLWFQEGNDTVPEPAIGALFGLGLLILAFKRHSNLPVLMFASALLSVPVLTTHAADSVVQVTADSAGLTLV
jgi:hypothetical protein